MGTLLQAVIAGTFKGRITPAAGEQDKMLVLTISGQEAFPFLGTVEPAG